MSRAGLAAALALAAFALFSAVDLLVKLASARLHPLQLVCIVAVLALVPPMAMVLARGDIRRLGTAKPLIHLMRGLAMLVGGVGAVFAYSLMPLADAYAVNFTLPLIVTALSWPLLGERVAWPSWLAVIIGFLGLLVMIRPGGSVLGIGAAFALINALFNGLALMLIRKLGPDEPVEACVLWGNLTIALGTAPTLFWIGQMPDLREALLLLGAGLGAGVSFLLLSRAFQLAPAAVVAPLQYSQMPLAIFWGYLVFGHRPEAGMLLGAAVVIGCGLFLIYREQKQTLEAAG